MATRRQREAAAPRPAANAGPRNQTAAAAARSAPRNQTAAAAATGRPHARNGRAFGDIGNHVNAPAVHGEANRRRHTRSLGAEPNAAVADENTIPHARPVAAVEGASASRVGRTESGEVNKLSTNILKLQASLAAATEKIEKIEITLDQEYPRLLEKYKQIAGDFGRLTAEFENEKAQKEAVMEELESVRAQKEAEVQKVEELESKKARKEAEVQKVMEENVRLRPMLDKKEAQLQAMSEQCKFMALNHHN